MYMQIKEKIHSVVDQMNMNELVLLYEHIRLHQEMKDISFQKRAKYSIEEIHAMTSLSSILWSDTVNQEREDRI